MLLIGSNMPILPTISHVYQVYGKSATRRIPVVCPVMSCRFPFSQMVFGKQVPIPPLHPSVGSAPVPAEAILPRAMPWSFAGARSVPDRSE